MSKSLMNGYGDTDFEEIQIPVPWGHIAGKWWGPKNIQPIIAIHGWQDNSGSFDKLAPHLRNKGLSMLCIDLPGHGFSSHLPPGQKYYIFWDGLHFLRRIVKYFNWRDVTIIGHSLGGAIAFLYAASYPNEVKKYVSIDIASPSVRDPKKVVNLLGTSVDKFLDYEKKGINDMPCYQYDEMVDLVHEAHGGSISRESSEIMLRRGMKPATHKEGFIFTRDPRLKVVALGFITMDQVMEMASRITCEVLNIKATLGIKLDVPEHYELVLDEIEKHANRLERVLLEGTHHLHLNDADKVAPYIYSFLVS